MNRKRQWEDGQHGWSILWVIGKSLGWGNLRGGWCHNLAKWLKLFFSFLFFSRLTIQEWSMRKYHVTKCHRVIGLWVTVRWCYMTKLHGNCGKIVHRSYSSCISSIGNLIGTSLSSSCQLRLEVVLRRLSLSSYTRTRYPLLEHCPP